MRTRQCPVWCGPHRASRGSTYRSDVLPPPKAPRDRWARYLSPASCLSNRRTCRTEQPQYSARRSWVTEHAPVPDLSASCAMASSSCFLRPLSGCARAHSQALELTVLRLLKIAFLGPNLGPERTAIFGRCGVYWSERGDFELPTPCSRSKCATRLRYAPPDRQSAGTTPRCVPTRSVRRARVIAAGAAAGKHGFPRRIARKLPSEYSCGPPPRGADGA